VGLWVLPVRRIRFGEANCECSSLSSCSDSLCTRYSSLETCAIGSQLSHSVHNGLHSPSSIFFQKKLSKTKETITAVLQPDTATPLASQPNDRLTLSRGWH